MALGRRRFTGTINSSTDTTLLTPEARERIHVLKANIFCSVAGTTWVATLRDGVGGAVLGGLNASTLGANWFQNWETVHERGEVRGRELTHAGALVINTVGTTGTILYDVEVEVRGG